MNQHVMPPGGSSGNAARRHSQPAGPLALERGRTQARGPRMMLPSGRSGLDRRLGAGAPSMTAQNTSAQKSSAIGRKTLQVKRPNSWWINEVHLCLRNDSLSFDPVHPLIRVFGPRFLHYAKGHGHHLNSRNPSRGLPSHTRPGCLKPAQHLLPLETSPVPRSTGVPLIQQLLEYLQLLH
jgi:hypothetical protein